jgi:hypothetical protein
MGSRSNNGMRKQEEVENAANHDNSSLTPRLKIFTSDEMGTTLKGGSHLCFITTHYLRSVCQRLQLP